MRNNSRKKSTKRMINKVNISSKKVIIVIAIIFMLLLFSTIFALTNSISEQMISGISINEVDISNLTINEAYDKLNAQLEERNKQKYKSEKRRI